MGFGILILILIWSLVFDTPIIQIFAFYIDVEGAKNIHVLDILIWDFSYWWRFLTGVWHLYCDLDIITSLWYTHIQILDSLSFLWRCKEHSCPLSPDLGLWRMLEVPDWCLASWSWFGYGHEFLIGLLLYMVNQWSLIHPWSKFRFSILILNVQRAFMSFKSSFGTLKDAEGSWCGFGILILFWIGSLVFDTPMIWILALYLDFEGAKNIHVL